VTGVTFIFETYPNTKAKEKKVGGQVPRVSHQIAPLIDSKSREVTLPHS